MFRKKKVVHLDPEAWERKVKRMRTAVICALAAVITGIGVYLLVSRVIIPSNAYSAAEAALAKGSIAEGIDGFSLLRPYRDSAKRAADAAYSASGGEYDRLKDAEIGDIIEFGSYEQDGNPMNGPEPIRWGVMMAENGTMYLMAVDVLDMHNYHTEQCPITWAECELRHWLNGEFLNAAFTENERLLIAKSIVSTANNTVSGTKGGASTEDKVFVMSHEELRRIAKNGDRLNDLGLYAYASKHAVKNGVEVSQYGLAQWWLRTPGVSQSTVTVTNMGGQPIYSRRPNYGKIGVRPCIWVLNDRIAG